MRTVSARTSKIGRMFARIREWLFQPTRVSARGYIRASGTQTIHKTVDLPATFAIEGRVISSNGKVTYLCLPTPKKVGQLQWFDTDRISVGDDIRKLVRSPSVCLLADPMVVRGELHYPEGEERAYIKFTVYPS